MAGPGTLTFWWKVSSEENFDFLRFFIDGVEQSGAIHGEVDWQQRTNLISSGTHTLRWRYEKDSSASEGQDAGWIDELHFSPASAPPLLAPTVVGTNFVFSFQSQTGLTHTIEFNDDLKTTNWVFLQTITGDGSLKQVTSPVVTVPQRFFRGRQP